MYVIGRKAFWQYPLQISVGRPQKKTFSKLLTLDQKLFFKKLNLFICILFSSKMLSNQNHQITVVSNCGKKSSILCIIDLSVQTWTQRY